MKATVTRQLGMLALGFLGMALVAGAAVTLAPVRREAAARSQPSAASAEGFEAGGAAVPVADEPRELSHDDGKAAGKQSIAGGGHVVRFEAPGEGWTLTAVKLHGSRYGYPRPPDEDFKIYLCDDSFQKLAEFPFPYATYERGPEKWVTMPVKATKVPAKFILCVGFNPEQTKGVYVSHDRENSGNSLVGLPGREPRPSRRGDWMIRAILTPPLGTQESKTRLE
jgi:RNA polymerase sigma-70 factor (ECF subfamily)